MNLFHLVTTKFENLSVHGRNHKTRQRCCFRLSSVVFLTCVKRSSRAREFLLVNRGREEESQARGLHGETGKREPEAKEQEEEEEEKKKEEQQEEQEVATPDPTV